MIRFNMVIFVSTLSAATPNLSRQVGIVKYFSLQSKRAEKLRSPAIPCGTATPGSSLFPNQDATVSFSISSSEGWMASNSDVLRGSKTCDDAEFSD
jgi:hypothetical protein